MGERGIWPSFLEELASSMPRSVATAFADLSQATCMTRTCLGRNGRVSASNVLAPGRRRQCQHRADTEPTQSRTGRHAEGARFGAEEVLFGFQSTTGSAFPRSVRHSFIITGDVVTAHPTPFKNERIMET